MMCWDTSVHHQQGNVHWMTPRRKSQAESECTDDKAFYFYSFPLSQAMPRLFQLMWSEREEMKALAINPQLPPHLGLHTPDWGSHLPLSFLLKTYERNLGGPQKHPIRCHWKAVTDFTADSGEFNYWNIKRKAPLLIKQEDKFMWKAEVQLGHLAHFCNKFEILKLRGQGNLIASGTCFKLNLKYEANCVFCSCTSCWEQQSQPSAILHFCFRPKGFFLKLDCQPTKAYLRDFWRGNKYGAGEQGIV